MAGRRDPWVRWFDVTNPKKHSGGYTVYKVTSKVFPVHSPEATTEIVVWKRYKDFLKLHKTLFLLHRNLHRPGIFPDFPKPQIFGRFDENIIEERRLASLELLNFVGAQAHLFNSLAVQQFFETSEACEGEKQTSEQEILQPISNEQLSTSSGQLAEEGSGSISSTEEERLTSANDADADERLPQGDYLGERPDLEVLSQEEITSQPELDCVTSGLEDGAPIGSETVDGLVQSLSGIWAHRHPDNSDSEQSDPESTLQHQSSSPLPQQSALFQLGDSQLDLPTDLMNEFDPCHQTSSPPEVPSASNSQLLAECHTTDQSGASLPAMDQTDSKLQPPADTLGEYIQSKEDYLYKAVKQIRKAKREENERHYQIAFDYYKRAVAMLLTGVQEDGDEARRSVVRRKTAEYLVYAEQLYNQYLDSSGGDSEMWRQQHVPRHVARLRTGLSELSNFKVLGLIGGNMLVMDKTSEQTYIIKVLQKNTEITDSSWSSQVIPTRCSRMIKLVKYFETESTIYLLLEYAQGGTLWQYVHNYLETPESNPAPPLADGADNIYSGKKYSTSSEAVADVAQQVKAKEEDECSLEYRNMVLGIEPESGQDLPAVVDNSLDLLTLDNSMDGPSLDNSMGGLAIASSVGGPGIDQAVVDSSADDSTGGPTIASAGDAHTCHVTPLEQGGSTEPQSPSDEVFSTEARTPDSHEPPATRRMSLRRSNSSKSRSVSVERASDSVNSARHRNWSTVFDDLEQTGNRKQSRPHLPESCVQRWAAELLMAIDELHRAGLILRDLQPDNLLLNSRGHIILTYFCRWPGVHQETDNKSIEHLYVSPEGTLPGGLCMASDYWSFGVLLYELLAGVSLSSVYPGGITSHTILQTPEHLSKEAEHLLKQLLRYNWRERLGGGAAGIDEIKSHPFFQTVDWTSV